MFLAAAEERLKQGRSEAGILQPTPLCKIEKLA